jgi:hypothetical protein
MRHRFAPTRYESHTLKAIPGFNINSVSYEMLAPIFDNDYGVMYSFKLQDFFAFHDLNNSLGFFLCVINIFYCYLFHKKS